MDLAWWIAVIGVPLIGAIFSADYLIHAALSKKADSLNEVAHGRITKLKDDIEADRRLLFEQSERKAKELNDFKTFVISGYATQAYAKEIENRLIISLDKIDGKLERIERTLNNGH